MSSLHLVLIFTRYIQSSFSSYIHSSFHFLKAIFLLLSSVLTRAEPYKLQFFIEDWENGNYPLLSFFFLLSLSLSLFLSSNGLQNQFSCNERDTVSYILQCLILYTLTSVCILSFFIHFPKVTDKENSFTDQKLLSLVIICFILMTLMCDSGGILLGEIRCHSLSGCKGLSKTWDSLVNKRTKKIKLQTILHWQEVAFPATIKLFNERFKINIWMAFNPDFPRLCQSTPDLQDKVNQKHRKLAFLS